MNDTVGGEFHHDFIARREEDAFSRGNLHEDALKARIPPNIGNQMVKVDIIFVHESRVCLCKVGEGNGFLCRDIHFLGEYLREAVDEKWLSPCLSMQYLDNFQFKTLPDFCRPLSKEFLYLFQRERR